MSLILRSALAALAISLGGSLLARALGYDIDPALFAVVGAIGGATLAAAEKNRGGRAEKR